MPNENQIQNINIYSPKAIVSIFEKAFTVQEERKIIDIKGIYLKDGKVDYNGYYYDHIKDEAADYTLSLIIPTLYRNQINHNTTILFKAFITRKIDKYGRIEFQVNFIELINTTANKFTEEDLQRIEIVNSKLTSGIKDIDAAIKNHVYSNTKMNIVVLLGKSAIVDNDIRSALGAAIALYNISFVRVNIASTTEIANKIMQYDNDNFTEVICIARGGGEQMEAFGKPELVKTILNRKKIIASAIGHADDVTLFEQAADKKFATPTAFGTYLKYTYESTTEDLSKSKAKMTKDITDQLKVIFDGQIKILNEKLEATSKLFLHEKKAIIENHEAYKKQLIDLNDKRIKDFQLNLNNASEENKRLNTQLNETRNSNGTGGYILVIIILVILFIAVLVSKK